MIHELKILPEYFHAVKVGAKPFEVRKDDRPFEVGDVLRLREFDGQKYTGEEVDVKVSYILRGSEFCKDGYCVLGTERPAGSTAGEGNMEWLRSEVRNE